MSVNDVLAYIKNAPIEQHASLKTLRGLIRAALPKAKEAIGRNGFPVYTIDGVWIAGIGTRTSCPMLYIMRGGALDRHAKTLGVLRSGKSCVQFRASRSLTLEELTALAQRMLKETAKGL